MCRFYDKTVNNWEDRESFVKHAGKYDLLAMDYEAKVNIYMYECSCDGHMIII